MGGGRKEGYGEQAVDDELLDPIPASVCQPYNTVHFAASPLLRCARPSLSAGFPLQKSSVATQGGISVLKPKVASSHLHNITNDLAFGGLQKFYLNSTEPKIIHTNTDFLLYIYFFFHTEHISAVCFSGLFVQHTICS